VYCVLIDHCRMGSSGYLYLVRLTLTAIGFILPLLPVEADKSLSIHHGQFGHRYDLCVSHAESVSILYNESHHQVIVGFCETYVAQYIVRSMLGVWLCEYLQIDYMPDYHGIFYSFLCISYVVCAFFHLL